MSDLEFDPRRNHLIDAIPVGEFDRIVRMLSPVKYSVGEIIYNAGDEITFGVFPVSGLVSRLHTTGEGSSVESGMVGVHGFLGLALFMGGDTMPNNAVAQVAGHGVRMSATDLKAEFFQGGIFQKVLLRYAQSTFSQIAQYAVCNRLHTIEEQLCRWLLTAHDELASQYIPMTHERIGALLGVRREGVSVAARLLQDKGFIRYSRGSITLVNRAGLLDHACECYRLVREDYKRLLGQD